MVAAHNIVVNNAVLQLIFQPLRQDKIVNPPSRVVLSRPKAIRPPAVGPGFVRIEIAEAVNKAAAQKLSHFRPLFIGKAGIFPVGFGIFQINLLMGNIQIAADDDRLYR